MVKIGWAVATLARVPILVRSSSAVCSRRVPFGIGAMSHFHSQSSNALLLQGNLPQFEVFQAKDVEAGMEKVLGDFQEQFSKFELEVSQSPVSYSQVVERLEALEAPVGFAWGLVSHLMSVKNSDELRQAFEKMQPKTVETMQRVGQSEAVYKALKQLLEHPEQLTPVQHRVVSKNCQGMELAGIGLQGEEREIFNKLNLEHSKLSNQFMNNVLDSTKAFQLLLREKEQVEGLPASALGLYAKSAVSNGETNATAENGPWLVTLDAPSYIAFMKYASRSDLREKVYRAYIARASSGELDNVPLMKEMIKIRQKKSAMLGFKSYADLSLSRKMAESPEKVLELVEFLRERSFSHAKKELEELEAYASKRSGQQTLNRWDLPYWSARLKEDTYGFSEEELRPYFALEKVLEGLFNFAYEMFGVRVVAADGETSVWHPDVRFFKLVDAQDGSHIGSFYLDPYARPGEKRGGAWMGPCIDRSKVLGRKPVAYLVCNGTPPTGDKPSLMTFSEVETLWHEFGHAFQHLVTKVEDAAAAGINNIEWDAVEIPSQWMEEWLYDKNTLYKFANHYETGEPLPEDLFNKLTASRHFHAGLFMLQQLNYGSVDMALHSADYDPETKDPIQLQFEVAKRFSVLEPLAEDRFLCSFQHIFGGGYAAGYYSYVYSRIMSSDAFAKFEEAGLDNQKAVHALGKEFRDTILALGGGTHPAQVFRKFRGRDPSPEAFLRHSGLQPLSAL